MVVIYLEEVVVALLQGMYQYFPEVTVKNYILFPASGSKCY
jgi:hypothetical protein